jgi:hypothetical protein
MEQERTALADLDELDAVLAGANTPMDEKEYLAWLGGRLAGLAGTVRYDLTDEDRDVIREASMLLGQARIEDCEGGDAA